MAKHIPAKTMELATPALDFERPLDSGDDRWVDLEAGRGSTTVARLKKLFERCHSHQRVAFASHRGAGKSTELHRLAHDLRNSYFPIYFEANVELDASTFAMEDLLLVVARVVEEEMRKAGKSLPESELAKVERWFGEAILTDDSSKEFLATVQSEAKLEGGVPFFAKLMSSLTASAKVASKHSDTFKQKLRNYPGALLQLVNNLLQAADKLLGQAQPAQRLLLLIDNLDRYEPKLIDALLIQGADRFKQLECSLIVTPPISLVLRPTSLPIDGVFTTCIMPTVKLRGKLHPYGSFSADGGRDALLAALGKRIDLETLVPDLKARDRMVAASGGAIRELLEIAQEVSLESNGPAMTLKDVETVLDRRRSRLRNRIDQNDWWDTLADIAEHKSVKADDKYLQVLFQRLAFEYNSDIWYDVHPLVAESLREKGMLRGPGAGPL